jgi:hypothetical protein
MVRGAEPAADECVHGAVGVDESEIRLRVPSVDGKDHATGS